MPRQHIEQLDLLFLQAAVMVWEGKIKNARADSFSGLLQDVDAIQPSPYKWTEMLIINVWKDKGCLFFVTLSN